MKNTNRNSIKQTILQHFLIAIILLLSSQSSAQNPIAKSDVKGYVKDARSGEALPFANIILKGTNRGTTTNTDGYFVLVNVPVGLCSLQVHYIGYESQMIRFENVPKGLPSFVIKMQPKVIEMDSIRKSMTLTVNWEQISDALYYILVENIDANPVALESRFGQRPGQFVSQPIAAGEYTVNAMMMTHLGKHRIKVYRVNQEYADLYQSRNQDSRDLNEPLTNIVNGLGVFSAFNSESVYFDFNQL